MNINLIIRFFILILITFKCVSCGIEIKLESDIQENVKIKSLEKEIHSDSNEDFILPIITLTNPVKQNAKNIFIFSFSSNKEGLINYYGNCVSTSKNAIKGDHHIRFVAMVEGTYDDCAIQVKDANGNISESLQIPKFTVDFTAPELTQTGDFKTEGRNLNLEIISSESGNLLYSGNCNGDLIYVKKGKSEIIIRYPGDGQYSDCELSLTDAAGNVSEPLSLGTIRIDTTPPALTEIKPVPEKIQTERPSYSFKTSKTGTLSFSGKCKGNVDKAVEGINHISLLTNEPGIYSDCSLVITDSANNKSQPLKISPFEVLGNS